MTFRTLLVHVDTERQTGARIDFAIALARKFEAHLTGLYVHMPDVAAYPTDFGPEALQELLRQDERAEHEATELFQSRVQRAGLPGTEWRIGRGYLEDIIGLHARYADMVIVGQPDPEHRAFYPLDFPALLTLTAARPVLAVPYAGVFTSIGRKALVAWNGSREATHAVTSALPLLKGAEKVTIIAINPIRGPLEHGEVPGADLALYLARHGVNAEVDYQEKMEIDAGEWLLSRAADLGVDLIVMGAYGHRRLREWALGGVTRTITRSMTVPVLMSH